MNRSFVTDPLSISSLLNYFYCGADEEGAWRRQNRSQNNLYSISFLFRRRVLGGKEGFPGRLLRKIMNHKIFILLPPYPLEGMPPYLAKPGAFLVGTGNHLEGKGPF